jgi:hypothetical protein
MIRNSLYQAVYNRKDQRLHLGHRYKDDLMRRVLSNQMFGANPIMDTFISFLQNYLYEHIESVKQIKIFANPALDKNENRFN